jgi:hypothetical protein
MTAIPPGKTHTVTIMVKGPKERKAVKAYMKKVRKAVGRIGKVTEKRPKPRKRR